MKLTTKTSTSPIIRVALCMYTGSNRRRLLAVPYRLYGFSTQTLRFLGVRQGAACHFITVTGTRLNSNRNAAAFPNAGGCLPAKLCGRSHPNGRLE